MASETEKVKGNEAPTIGVFFSPPEAPRFDSFSSSSSYQMQPNSMNWDSRRKAPSLANLLSTPPVSPHTVTTKERGHADVEMEGSSITARDPQLFPEGQLDAQTQTTQPLFSTQSRSPTAEALRQANEIDEHIQKRRRTHPTRQIPTRRQYEDFVRFASSIYFTPRVVPQYNRNPQAYIDRQIAEYAVYDAANPKKHLQPSTAAVAQRPRVARREKVEKMPRVRRAPRPPPVNIAAITHAVEHQQAIQPVKKAERRKPSTTAQDDDISFAHMFDYSPPLSTLDGSGKSLKVEWHGGPLDLSNDPHRQILHPDELKAASTLRLTCAQYLSTKRRLFAARLECLRDGRAFNKTAAQQACKIDVNKASKLWVAYDKIGWLDPRHMQTHL